MSTSSQVIKLSSRSDIKLFIRKNKRCIIMYGAKYCGSCNTIYPLYKRASKCYHKKLTFAYVDTKNSHYGITAIPMFKGYYRGKFIDDVIGDDKQALKELIHKLTALP